MTYSLQFHEKALKEWKKLDETTRSQLKKKLAERLQNPHIQADRLSGFSNPTYKIKLRSIGYRLVYEVNDDIITVFVLSVGKRNKLQAYINAHHRAEKMY
ncbi:type II toxin-antitoxin system RelE/ParE family toxin [Gallibacterium anatis]|uniref:Type II toxin-antitoxin system RelE/ParE family toxin n=5 Tax=Gallibacterium anatis TaxID=750 RepID=A0A0A2XZI3_9PAST|nr:type II toxin-antitoxin system RelE/ParE family toxin [Gallibacterium anatis]AEC18143.1 Plasmid stabilization system protein [Gallibacterium anatis UMN179]ERF78861.1 RelE toxin [Gallibacterium anatis 12656/12]KGQ27594.1 RelE toxin [Gallibacterium anatis]KGQ28359.1 RelE toxin [Gallibacterium anatis]KGQ36267.1 RelE toxin [Gallibacterium anatis]